MVKKFIIFVLLQVSVLAYMALSHYAVEWYGEEVRLKTAPVDPKDILYGDYVILNYEISDIEISRFAGDRKPERGDAVYVLLKKEGEYHQLVSAHLQKPLVSEGERVLKGRVEYVSYSQGPSQGDSQTLQTVHVLYGFERYYVPEGKGKELEEKRGQFDVTVKVTPWGQKLSNLTFIANDVMTQWEVQDLVYQHYEQKSIPIEITRSQLVNRYESIDRPVWLVEIWIYPKKMDSKTVKSTVVVVDAKSGEILEQKWEPSN